MNKETKKEKMLTVLPTSTIKHVFVFVLYDENNSRHSYVCCSEMREVAVTLFQDDSVYLIKNLMRSHFIFFSTLLT